MTTFTQFPLCKRCGGGINVGSAKQAELKRHPQVLPSHVFWSQPTSGSEVLSQVAVQQTH